MKVEHVSPYGTQSFKGTHTFLVNSIVYHLEAGTMMNIHNLIIALVDNIMSTPNLKTEIRAQTKMYYLYMIAILT